MKILSSTRELRSVTTRPDAFPAFPVHLHPNLEICYVTEGFRTVLLQQCTYRVNQGDLMVIFPFQTHGFPNDGEGFGQLICCHPLSLPGFTTQMLTLVPSEPIIPADRIPERLCTLLALIFETPENNNRNETLNSLFTVFFLELLDILPLTPYGSIQMENAQRLLITCMNESHNPVFSLDSLARTCGMSTRTVSYFFNKRMNISFPRFMSMLRLRCALDQINNRTSITEAALSSGFGSVCSFNRAFRQEYGITPREYIRHNFSNSEK